MVGVANYPGENADETILPRFLRDDASGGTGLNPPPLPRPTWMLQMGRRVQVLSAQLLAVRALFRPALAKPVLAKPVLAAAALAPVLASGTYVVLSILAPPQQQVPIVPHPMEAQRPRNDVAEALKLVAELEARITYAQNPQALAEVAAAVTAGASAPVAVAEGEGVAPAITAATPSDVPIDEPRNEPDPIGLLLLANVPEGATFLDGQSTGKGTWAMAAGGPEQLVTALGEGFDTPVIVDVEMISSAGVSVGAVKVQLHKPAQSQPVAQPVAEAKPDAGEDQAAPSNGEAPEAKPPKRKRQVHRTYRVARSNLGGLRQRRVAVDAYQVRQADAARQQPPDAGGNANAVTVDAEPQPSGPISKFFAWLKSGSKKTDATAAEPMREPDVNDNDVRRGLGMMPGQ